MDKLLPLISTVGFPIVICLYVLIRLETTLKENTKAITALVYKLK